MSLTFTERKPPEFVGSKKHVQVLATFDNSYPTGGEAVSLAALGMTRLDRLEVQTTGAANATGWVVDWDRSRSAPKLIVFNQSDADNDVALTQVPNTTNLSTLSVLLNAIGV